MQMFNNLPWYGYVILGVAVISIIGKFIYKSKRFLNDPDLKNAKFRENSNTTLTDEQVFSLSLDTVTTEYWEVDTNTLYFKKNRGFKDYLEGWGINTKEGYWWLTDYFMKDGRRWYFDFIYEMIQKEPKENWDALMQEKFGENERADRYLKHLSSGKALEMLKTNGFITFDSEIEVGVVAYDASVLIGQARRAFSAELISEEEAWKVINYATHIAKESFSSWDEFAKSYILGFTLDMRHENKEYFAETYHLYKQVVENPKSPWKTIEW